MDDNGSERLGLQQKIRLLTGADLWSLPAEPAVGLRSLVVSDGPAGVRGRTWDERSTSANLPCPSAIAASWDPERAHRLGRLLAAECRRSGVDVLLAPTVNLQRSPYAGRHFEYFSEDPGLTATIGSAYVQGLQSQGIGATVKHFVANDSETQRFTVDARIDERVLRELYLYPFEVIVREGGAWAVMAAYNGVNGTTMTESPMLREILQQEWGFDGVTMTDWFAGRSTVASALAGLDLIMPGPGRPLGGAAHRGDPGRPGSGRSDRRQGPPRSSTGRPGRRPDRHSRRHPDRHPRHPHDRHPRQRPDRHPRRHPDRRHPEARRFGEARRSNEAQPYPEVR